MAAVVVSAPAASSRQTQSNREKKKKPKHFFSSWQMNPLIHHLLLNSNSSVQHPWVHCRRPVRKRWSLWHQELLLSKKKQQAPQWSPLLWEQPLTIFYTLSLTQLKHQIVALLVIQAQQQHFVGRLGREKQRGANERSRPDHFLLLLLWIEEQQGQN